MVHLFIYGVLLLSIICNLVQVVWPVSVLFERTSGVSHVRRALVDDEGVTNMEHIAGIPLTPGARKIFIDLGANDGSSTTFFLDKSTNGNLGIAVQGGDDNSFLKGLGSSKDWEVVVFEANSQHTARLEQLRKSSIESNSVKNFTLYGGTAISKESGTVTFIWDGQNSGSAGATTVPESKSAVGPHFTIPSVGIIDLFHTLKIHHSDFVIVKMDIEGYEFELMRHIISHGIHTRIDVIAVEYHDTNPWVLGGVDATKKKYETQHKCLDWMMEDLHNMKVLGWGR
jgi:FkbM family methyltransferase